jgi:hypothetical protein
MKNLNFKLIGLGLFLVAASSYTVVYFKRQIRLLKQTCFTYAGGTIKKLSLRDALFTIYINVKNRSDIGIKILNQEYEVLINGILILTIKKPLDVVLKAGATSKIDLDVNFSPAELIKQGVKNAQSIISNPSNLMITIKANISVGSSFVFVNNIKFETTSPLSEYLAPSDVSFTCEGENHNIKNINIKK